jgi:hypothetical protein
MKNDERGTMNVQFSVLRSSFIIPHYRLKKLMIMSPALRALLSGIIDYAGLFPPASLPLEPAIRNYARYRTEPEAWMLGRFICPAERLNELAPFVEELFATGPALALSVLGRNKPGDRTGEEELVHKLDADDTVEFRERHSSQLECPFYETRIRYHPAEKSQQEDKESVFRQPRHQPIWRVWPFQNSYYEIEISSDWRAAIAWFIHYTGKDVRTIRDEHTKRGTPLPANVIPKGFKLRCGGLNASAFPPAEQIGFAIIKCRDAGIPFKATAGLHHPIRQYRDEVKTKMHGFLNVFGAGVLAHACKLTEEQVLAIIEDEDPKNFVFDDAIFRWKDYRITVEQITAARKMVTSFGSCSFDEPRDDLRALGLL